MTLHVQLQTSETDKFLAHLYQAPKQYRLVSERPNKGNRATERLNARLSQATGRAGPGLQGRLPRLAAPGGAERKKVWQLPDGAEAGLGF